jgi:hypothetical protein
VILLIANGALSSQMIYIINTNLCWGSIIWWIACLIIELFCVGKQLWYEICSKWCPSWISECCLPTPAPVVERNEEEYIASVRSSIEEEFKKALATADLYESLLSTV